MKFSFSFFLHSLHPCNQSSDQLYLTIFSGYANLLLIVLNSFPLVCIRNMLNNNLAFQRIVFEPRHALTCTCQSWRKMLFRDAGIRCSLFMLPSQKNLCCHFPVFYHCAFDKKNSFPLSDFSKFFELTQIWANLTDKNMSNFCVSDQYGVDWD